MQKARIMFNEKFILNDNLLIHKELFFDEEDDEKIYYAFFDDATVALYDSRSQFVMKINAGAPHAKYPPAGRWHCYLTQRQYSQSAV